MNARRSTLRPSSSSMTVFSMGPAARRTSSKRRRVCQSMIPSLIQTESYGSGNAVKPSPRLSCGFPSRVAQSLQRPLPLSSLSSLLAGRGSAGRSARSGDLEQVGQHDVLPAQPQVEGIRQLLDALDLCPVGLENVGAGKKAEVDHAHLEAELFELTRRFALTAASRRPCHGRR